MERIDKLADEITNELMDYFREHFDIEEDSDEDDALYSMIHNKVRSVLNEQNI